MILAAELGITMVAVEARRDSYAFIAHMSLQVALPEIAFFTNAALEALTRVNIILVKQTGSFKVWKQVKVEKRKTMMKT